MPEENKVTPVVEQQAQGAYSAEYVKSLRDEAASWRSKLRDTESSLTQSKNEISQIKLETTVGAEIKKRNLTIDPSWVKMEEGQSVEQAVDAILKKHPNLATETTPTQEAETRTFTTKQKPMAVNNPNTNVNLTPVNEYDAVKKDPVARAKLREQYRSMLTISRSASGGKITI